MTVKTMVSTEALEPGDLVSHEDIPRRVATGRVVGTDTDNPGYVVVLWPRMIPVSVKSDRLRLEERPEGYAVVDFMGGSAFGMDPVDAYTFVVAGDAESIAEDMAIYQDAPGYSIRSSRLGREDSAEESADDD